MMKRNHVHSQAQLTGLSLKALPLLVAASLLLSATLHAAGVSSPDNQTEGLYSKGPCSTTSMAAYSACFNEGQDDYWIGWGTCNNIDDEVERNGCFHENRGARQEGNDECLDGLEGRDEVCELLGQGRYDPEYAPEDFVDPDAIGDTVDPNPYFPLIPGYRWVYEGDGELIVVEVMDETKEIDGVLCRVVRDTVSEVASADDNGENSPEADEDDGNGEANLIEDTIDWYAQDTEGNVWYFGESSQSFEDGDLDNLDGSWRTGKEGAKPGILVHAMPVVDSVYRQEFFLGDAEDLAQVVSLNAMPELAEGNPADCSMGCLQTDEWTPIEADSHEFKYYQPGLGFIKEVKPATGEAVELVEFSN